MTAHNPISSYLTPEDVARAERISPKLRRATVKGIAAHVSDLTGIPVDMILGTSRKANVKAARHLTWFIARQQGMSLPQIAAASGHDHSTVLHGIRREEEARKAEVQA